MPIDNFSLPFDKITELENTDDKVSVLQDLAPELIYACIEVADLPEEIKTQLYQNETFREALKASEIYQRLTKIISPAAIKNPFAKPLQEILEGIAEDSPALARVMLSLYAKLNSEQRQNLNHALSGVEQKRAIGKALGDLNRKLVALHLQNIKREKLEGVYQVLRVATDRPALIKLLSQLPVDEIPDDSPQEIRELNQTMLAAAEACILKEDSSISDAFLRQLNHRAQLTIFERTYAARSPTLKQKIADLVTPLDAAIAQHLTSQTVTIPEAIPALPPEMPVPQMTFGSDGRIDDSFGVDMRFLHHTASPSLDPSLEGGEKVKVFSLTNFQSMEMREFKEIIERDLSGGSFVVKINGNRKLVWNQVTLNLMDEHRRPTNLFAKESSASASQVVHQVFAIINHFIQVTPAMLEFLKIALLGQTCCKAFPANFAGIIANLVQQYFQGDGLSEEFRRILFATPEINASLQDPVATVKSPREVEISRDPGYRFVGVDRSAEGTNFREVQPTITHLSVRYPALLPYWAQDVMQRKAPEGYWLSAYDVKVVVWALQKAMLDAKIKDTQKELTPLVVRLNDLIQQNDEVAQAELREIISNIQPALLTLRLEHALAPFLEEVEVEEVEEYDAFGAHKISHKKFKAFKQKAFSPTENLQRYALSAVYDAHHHGALSPQTIHQSFVLMDTVGKSPVNTQALMEHFKNGSPEALAYFVHRLATRPNMVARHESDFNDVVPKPSHAPLSGGQLTALVLALPDKLPDNLRARGAAEVLEASQVSYTTLGDVFRNFFKTPGFFSTLGNWFKSKTNVPDYRSVLNGEQFFTLLQCSPAQVTELLSVEAHRVLTSSFKDDHFARLLLMLIDQKASPRLVKDILRKRLEYQCGINRGDESATTFYQAAKENATQHVSSIYQLTQNVLNTPSEENLLAFNQQFLSLEMFNEDLIVYKALEKVSQSRLRQMLEKQIAQALQATVFLTQANHLKLCLQLQTCLYFVEKHKEPSQDDLMQEFLMNVLRIQMRSDHFSVQKFKYPHYLSSRLTMALTSWDSFLGFPKLFSGSIAALRLSLASPYDALKEIAKLFSNSTYYANQVFIDAYLRAHPLPENYLNDDELSQIARMLRDNADAEAMRGFSYVCMFIGKSPNAFYQEEKLDEAAWLPEIIALEASIQKALAAAEGHPSEISTRAKRFLDNKYSGYAEFAEKKRVIENLLEELHKKTERQVSEAVRTYSGLQLDRPAPPPSSHLDGNDDSGNVPPLGPPSKTCSP